MATDDDKAPHPGDVRKRPTGGKKPTLGNPDANPQRIHREYVERHVGGGEDPTPEAYERGAEQWRRLPGSITRTPAELRGESADTNTDDSSGDESAHDHDSVDVDRGDDSGDGS